MVILCKGPSEVFENQGTPSLVGKRSILIMPSARWNEDFHVDKSLTQQHLFTIQGHVSKGTFCEGDTVVMGMAGLVRTG